jgi:hypothetical protein
MVRDWKYLGQLARSVVSEQLARNGGVSSEDTVLAAQLAIARGARQLVASRFAEAAQSYGDGMDMFDNKDRSHRSDFADYWNRETAAQAAAWDIAAARPTEAAPSVEESASTLLDGAGGAIGGGEAAIVAAALEFARREWSLEAAEAAQEARDCANDPRQGSGLLHELADRWTQRAAEYAGAQRPSPNPRD